MDDEGMIFVAHWTHTPENCPGGSKEGATMLNEFWAKRDLAEKKGIKILSAYVAVTEHTYYITVRAKDYQSIHAGVFRAVGPDPNWGYSSGYDDG